MFKLLESKFLSSHWFQMSNEILESFTIYTGIKKKGLSNSWHGRALVCSFSSLIPCLGREGRVERRVTRPLLVPQDIHTQTRTGIRRHVGGLHSQWPTARNLAGAGAGDVS